MDKQKFENILNMTYDVAFRYKMTEANMYMSGKQQEFEPCVLPKKSDFQAPEPTFIEKLNKKKYAERVERERQNFEAYVDEMEEKKNSVIDAINYALESIESSIQSASNEKMVVTQNNPAKLGDVFQLIQLAVSLGLEVPNEIVDRTYKTSMQAFEKANELGAEEISKLNSDNAVAYSWDIGHLSVLMKYKNIPMTKNDYDVMMKFNHETCREQRNQAGFEPDRSKYVEDNSSYFKTSSTTTQVENQIESNSQSKAEDLDFLKILNDAYEWYHEENKKKVQKCIDQGKEAYDDLGTYIIRDALNKEVAYSLNAKGYKHRIALCGNAYTISGKPRNIEDLKQEKDIILSYLRNNFKWDLSNSTATNPKFEDELIQDTYKEIENYYKDIIKEIQAELREAKQND